MRVLVTFAGGRGHLLPMVPVARALREAGHELALSGHPDGVEDHGVFTELVPHERLARSTGQPGTGSLAPPDLAHERAVVGRWYAGTLAARTLPLTRDLVARWRPDLLVCDEMDFGSIAAAARAGVPCIVVDVIATGALTRADHVDAPLAALGLTGRRHGDLRVVPFPPSWREPGTGPGGTGARGATVHVRPEAPTAAGEVHPAATWLAEGAEPAYLTLGTVFNLESGDLFVRLVDGLLAGADRVLATVGHDLDPALLAGRAGNDRLRVARWVPQDQVLGPLAGPGRSGAPGVVVCHGGSGSVMAALTHGVPVVVAAMGADQELNAGRVEALGVGVALDPVASTSGQVREAVAHVRSDPGVRAAVDRVRDEMAALPPAASLVGRLESLVEAHQGSGGMDG